MVSLSLGSQADRKLSDLNDMTGQLAERLSLLGALVFILSIYTYYACLKFNFYVTQPRSIIQHLVMCPVEIDFGNQCKIFYQTRMPDVGIGDLDVFTYIDKAKECRYVCHAQSSRRASRMYVDVQ